MNGCSCPRHVKRNHTMLAIFVKTTHHINQRNSRNSETCQPWIINSTLNVVLLRAFISWCPLSTSGNFTLRLFCKNFRHFLIEMLFVKQGKVFWRGNWTRFSLVTLLLRSRRCFFARSFMFSGGTNGAVFLAELHAIWQPDS